MQVEDLEFIEKETTTQVFSCEFCKILQNTFFKEYVWTAASAPPVLLNKFVCWRMKTTFSYLIFYNLLVSFLQSLWGLCWQQITLIDFPSFKNHYDLYGGLDQQPSRISQSQSRTRQLTLLIKRNKNNIRTNLFPQGENNALVWKFCGDSREAVRFLKLFTRRNSLFYAVMSH